MKVKDVMDPSPDIIRTSDTFEHLIKILGEVKYHVVFVVDGEDKLVGIVTEGDIIKVLIPKYITVDESLISVMDVNYFERKCKENKNLPINEINVRNFNVVVETQDFASLRPFGNKKSLDFVKQIQLNFIRKQTHGLLDCNCHFYCIVRINCL